jgi:serine/threonine protein kinase
MPVRSALLKREEGNVQTSAEMLEGLNLQGNWTVVEKVNPGANATGGCFSTGYIIQGTDGRKAFLKALDYSRALRSPDPARALQALTEAYNFERDVLRKCKDRRLDRVVLALDDGVLTAPDGGKVQYLILELAEGDVRSHPDFINGFDLALVLRALHHAATGLKQLHGQGIAHQDLKPSNVLVFPERSWKLTDLGRSALKGSTPPHHDYTCPGDRSYAPPEQLYGQVDLEWNRRRYGSDAYLLGSMVVYFFAGVGTTQLIHTELDPSHSWLQWSGTYGDVLPYVRDAFGRVVDRFEQITQSLPDQVRPELVASVRELCEPDPFLRGHHLTRLTQGNPYALDRYVSRFNLLASRAENMLKKAAQQ